MTAASEQSAHRLRQRALHTSHIKFTYAEGSRGATSVSPDRQEPFKGLFNGQSNAGSLWLGTVDLTVFLA
jgi:hypothetical protein